MMSNILVGSFLPAWLRSRGFVLVAFAALSLSLALQSLMAFDHNDFLYAASAVRSGALYRDVHYVQGPVGFYFWHFLAGLAPDGHIYLTLRAVSFALVLLTVGLILAFILESATARLVFIVLVAGSFSITKIGSEIGTYSLALCLVVSGLVLLLREKRGNVSLAIAGVLFGLAAGAKLNHALLAIPAFLWLVYVESRHSRKRAIRSGALFGIGTLIGLLPILSYAGTPWQMFVFHTLTFHTELSKNMRGLGILEVLNNLQNGFFRFFRSTLILLIPATLLIVLDPTKRSRGAMYLGLTVAGIIMSALPIIFAAYLAPAAMFINLAFCHAVVPVDGQIRGMILWMALPLFLLYAVHNVVSDGIAPLMAGSSRLLAVERIATQLRGYAASFNASKPDCTREMFTFSGAVAVDSGFSLTPYTEAGMFWKHLDGFIPPRYKSNPAYAFDPNLVEPSRWVKARGIDFLVTGFYPKYDVGLVKYADAEGFATAPLGELLGQDIVLRYRPECLASP